MGGVRRPVVRGNVSGPRCRPCSSPSRARRQRQVDPPAARRRVARGAGIPRRVTKEPGGTPLGDALRALFLDPRWGAVDGVVELLLVFASRRQHLLEVDRAGARRRPARALRPLHRLDAAPTRATDAACRSPLIDQVDRLATGGRTPDRTLLFDLPAEVARPRGHSPSRQERGEADRLDAEDLAFYERVRRRLPGHAPRRSPALPRHPLRRTGPGDGGAGARRAVRSPGNQVETAA